MTFQDVDVDVAKLEQEREREGEREGSAQLRRGSSTTERGEF